MIKHTRILPGGLAVLVAVFLCLLTACRDHSRDGMSAADITLLNHGPDAIVSVQVNGYGGPRANSYGGGGGFCCVMVPNDWRPGLTAKITWTSDPNSWMRLSDMPDNYAQYYQHHGPITVPIERWEKGQACGFHVHIFPCDKVRIVRSCVLPGGAGSARST